jgi:hypothetical protein
MEIIGLCHALAFLRGFSGPFSSQPLFALQDFRVCKVAIFVDASVHSCLPKADLGTAADNRIYRK